MAKFSLTMSFAICEMSAMTPANYMQENRLTWEAWANRLGVSLSHLYEVGTGRKRGSADFLFKIEDDTSGVVTAREIQAVREDYERAHTERSNGAAA